MLNVQLQIALLYRQKNERDGARECLGCHFDKAGAKLARLVHFYRTEVSVIHVHLLNEILTLQTYKRWMSRKAGQKMLIEDDFHVVVDIHSRTTRPILRLHLDLASELIILCEYCYHRDF